MDYPCTRFALLAGGPSLAAFDRDAMPDDVQSVSVNGAARYIDCDVDWFAFQDRRTWDLALNPPRSPHIGCICSRGHGRLVASGDLRSENYHCATLDVIETDAVDADPDVRAAIDSGLLPVCWGNWTSTRTLMALALILEAEHIVCYGVDMVGEEHVDGSPIGGAGEARWDNPMGGERHDWAACVRYLARRGVMVVRIGCDGEAVARNLAIPAAVASEDDDASDVPATAPKKPKRRRRS